MIAPPPAGGFGNGFINPNALLAHSLLSQGHVPAPQLAPGTYDGNYAALGLRSSNPGQAAQLWESRHPGAMRSGNIPSWVLDAQTQALQHVMGNPPHMIHGFPPQGRGDLDGRLEAFHAHGRPEDINRFHSLLHHPVIGPPLQRLISSIVPAPAPVGPPGPPVAPSFQAQ